MSKRFGSIGQSHAMAMRSRLRSIETVFTRAADGGVLRHIGIAFDITAEKTAEANLHEVNAALKQQLVDGADSI